jgi:hypothetical protein
MPGDPMAAQLVGRRQLVTASLSQDSPVQLRERSEHPVRPSGFDHCQPALLHAVATGRAEISCSRCGYQLRPMCRLWNWPEQQAVVIDQPDKKIAQVLEELRRVMSIRRKPCGT